MIIKKFLGKTEEEAVEAAKKELGNGIVIMNVKDVKRKGLFSFFRSKQVEVTVALEEEKEALERTARQSMGSPKDSVRAQAKAAQAKPEQNTSPDSIEKKLESLKNLLESQFKSQMQSESVSKDEEFIYDKVAEAESAEKKAPESVEPEENPEQEKFIRILYNTMLDNEVDEKYINQILEDIDKSKKPNIPIDYILTNVYQKMILKFGKSEGIIASDKKPKIIIFIGPTGVGKTTTIAKVASQYTVEEKQKVALLTTDTYRIAAAEQLRTYANILEVPFRVIYTEEEMKNAVRDFAEYDYIFVDTTGHSYQNEEQIESLKEILKVIEGIAEHQTFLVLSATTKYYDLLKIAQSYKDITDYQFIFTKLDETTTVGNLLNLKLYVDTPIAYVTYGQNVPDDIERFNPQKAVKQLLDGRREK